MKTFQLFITRCGVRLGPQKEDARLALSTPKTKEPGTIGAGHLDQGLFKRQSDDPCPTSSKQSWKVEGKEIIEIYVFSLVERTVFISPSVHSLRENRMLLSQTQSSGGEMHQEIRS